MNYDITEKHEKYPCQGLVKGMNQIHTLRSHFTTEIQFRSVGSILPTSSTGTAPAYTRKGCHAVRYDSELDTQNGYSKPTRHPDT